jgi:hypothetical protein
MQSTKSNKKKEAVYVFSMAIILIAMFTLKGVQLIEVVQ